MKRGFNHMDKVDFLEACSDAHKKAFIVDNIKSGFRTTGLILFNPGEVLGHFLLNSLYGFSQPIQPLRHLIVLTVLIHKDIPKFMVKKW